MTIRRAPRKESNFTILSNELINDHRLSWDAMGILIYLLSKPDHWEVSVQQLVNERRGAKKTLGRDAIYRILNELIELGYINRTHEQDRSGKFAGYSYEVQEVPFTDQPYTGEPSTANPTQESTEVKKGLSERNNGDCGESPSADPGEDCQQGGTDWDAEFEAFWFAARTCWFGRPGNKQKARTAFLSRVKGTKSQKPTHQPQELIDLAKQDAKRRRHLEERDGFCPYQPHIVRWLRDECWDDELETNHHKAAAGDGMEDLVWN